MLPLVSIIQRALDRAPVLALFALACMASGTGTAAGSPNVLERFAAHPATARTYQLGIGGCREAGCPIEVRLAAGNKVIDTAVLEWPASDARAKRAPKLDWQAAAKQFEQHPAEAFLVTAGSFASIEQARQMRASNHGCLAHYWVLGAASSAAEQGPVIVATLSSTRQAAHHEMRRAKACAPSIRTDMKVVEGSRVP